MRTTLTALLVPALLFAAGAARADEPPPDDKIPATEAAPPTESAPAESAPATEALKEPAAAEEPAAAATTAMADKPEEILLPPGFKPKKRGKYMLYCRQDPVLGSRFPAERCYDADGIRAYIREMHENAEKVDQMRRICSSQGQCAPH